MPPRLAQFLPRLGRPRAGHLLVACGLFIGLVLAAAVTWFTLTSRRAVIDDAVREMRNDALMLAEDDNRLLQAVDAVQLGLIRYMREIGIDTPEQFEQLMASREVHQNLADRIAGMAYIASLSLSDRHGDLLNFSRAWPVPPIKSGDHDFIRALTAPGALPTFISQPVRSNVTGQWITYRSRRFESADGRLIGFVTNTIILDYFERFFARLPLTGDGAFTLYRRDGILMARYPHLDPAIGGTLGGTENFRRLLDAGDDGVIRQTSLLDGADRLHVPHALPHYPLLVAVSDTMDSILHDWRGQIRFVVATAGLLELLIAASILLAIRHLRSRDKLLTAETARAGRDRPCPRRAACARRRHTAHAGAALGHGAAKHAAGPDHGRSRWHAAGGEPALLRDLGPAAGRGHPGHGLYRADAARILARQCSTRRYGRRVPAAAGAGRADHALHLRLGTV